MTDDPDRPYELSGNLSIARKSNYRIWLYQGTRYPSISLDIDMSFCTQWPGAVTLLLCLLCLCNNACERGHLAEKYQIHGHTPAIAICKVFNKIGDVL